MNSPRLFFFPLSPLRLLKRRQNKPWFIVYFTAMYLLKDYSDHLVSLHERSVSLFSLSWLRESCFCLDFWGLLLFGGWGGERISDSAAEEIFRGYFSFLKFTVLGGFQLSRFPLPQRFLFLVHCQFPFSSPGNKADPWLSSWRYYFTHGCIYVIQILHFPLVMTSDPEEWPGKQSNRSQK